MATKKEKVTESIETVKAGAIKIQRARVQSIGLEISGTSEIIQNNFSQKAVEEMLKKHMGISVERERKKPREVLENATIKNVAGAICVPPTGIKKAMLTAAGNIRGLKKTQLRTSLFVEGNSIPISFEEMVPRMDMVRTGGISRAPDVRFRPSFHGWKARLIIQFSDTMQPQSVVDLLDRAGQVGLCEWRPEKNGTFGVFRVTRHIDDMKEIAEVRIACEPRLVPLVIPAWALDAEIDPVMLRKVFDEQSELQGDDEEEPKQKKVSGQR